MFRPKVGEKPCFLPATCHFLAVATQGFKKTSEGFNAGQSPWTRALQEPGQRLAPPCISPYSGNGEHPCLA